MKKLVGFLLYCIIIAHSFPFANSSVIDAIERGNDAYIAGDYSLAAMMYSIAARADHPSGQMGLGHIHGQDLGVPQDLKQAYMWFHLASINGSTHYGTQVVEIGRREGKEAKNQLDKRMSRSDREAALVQANRCTESGFEYCGGLPEKVIFSARCAAAIFIGGSSRIPLPNLHGRTSNFYVDAFMTSISPYDGNWYLDEIGHRSGWQYSRMTSTDLGERIQWCVDRLAIRDDTLQ